MSAIVGEKLIFGQENGNTVQLTVYGDEFYARYETAEGYTVVYDLDLGVYCYAMLKNDEFTSSGVSIDRPAPVGFKKHLKEPDRTRNRKFKARYQAIRPPERVGESNVMRTLGAADGLLTGRQVSVGKVKGLTILMEFQDVQSEVTKADVSAMLNDLDYQQNGNYCSVRKYYQIMSGGNLDYTNVVVGPVRLSKKQSHYINNSPMKEALQLAIKAFDLKLSDYDSRKEGVVDALSFLYAGRTLYKNWLWPHNSVVKINDGTATTHYYTIQSMGRQAVDLSIGTFAHETGHMLCRFPDLYDYGERDGDFEKSAGLGRYCLMSSGNHLNQGRTPSPICAYLRDLTGWCDKQYILNESRRFTAVHGDYDAVLRFNTDTPTEYFLVENRVQNGLDKYLPASGLAVYHCDTMGSNELEDGTPDRHYQCALLQADGHRDLENDFNDGDAGDLYGKVDTVALSKDSTPSSRTWRGSDSGFLLRDISQPSKEISFFAGQPLVQNKVSVSAQPDLIIPDNDPKGVTSTLAVNAKGSVAALSVTVDITHTYRGDLTGELIAPSGKKVVLFKKKSDPHDDIHLVLDSEKDNILSPFKGEAVFGKWKLTVTDTWKADVGRLDNFALTFALAPTEEVIETEKVVDKPIPDLYSSGITSSISCTANRSVSLIEVGVDITHAYFGDLQLTLISPSGTRALLKAADVLSGGSAPKSFNIGTTPSLKAMQGENATGDWRLEVCDMVRSDTGTLDRWRLRVVVE